MPTEWLCRLVPQRWGALRQRQRFIGRGWGAGGNKAIKSSSSFSSEFRSHTTKRETTLVLIQIKVSQRKFSISFHFRIFLFIDNVLGNCFPLHGEYPFWIQFVSSIRFWGLTLIAARAVMPFDVTLWTGSERGTRCALEDCITFLVE